MFAEKIESQIQLLEFHIKLCVIFRRLWISVKKLLILAEVAIRVRKLHCIFVCVYVFCYTETLYCSIRHSPHQELINLFHYWSLKNGKVDLFIKIIYTR